MQRMAKWLEVETGVLKEAIRASAYVHVDETGWKINGTNHWLWAFANQKLILPQKPLFSKLILLSKSFRKSRDAVFVVVGQAFLSDELRECVAAC